MADFEQRSTAGACIACGNLTDNTEHVCTECTAGARARLRVRQLTDDDLMAKPVGGDRDCDASRDASTNKACREWFERVNQAPWAAPRCAGPQHRPSRPGGMKSRPWTGR